MGKPTPHTLHLSEVAGRLAICRLDATAEIPAWAGRWGFHSITRTSDELSVVCPQEHVPAEVVCESGWRCLKVEGPLDFGMIGVLASIAGPLAEAGISIFALGTYDTDYILIKEQRYDEAVSVLSAAGHRINRRAAGDQRDV
jgi:uncharacterized protein